MRKTAAEVEALRAAGAAIDRVHARVPGWLRPGRTEREVGRRHRRRDPGRGPRPGRLRDRRPPGRTRPARTTSVSDRVLARRRRGRGGHRRHHAQRLLLGLHPDLRDRRAAARVRRVLPGAQGRPGGRLRGGPAGGQRRGGGRRGPGADHRGRLRRALHPPHRARHRPGDATRTPTSWPATPSCSSRAWRSPSSPASTPAAARRPDRGHRGVHRRRRRAAEQRRPASSWWWRPDEPGAPASDDRDEARATASS